MSCFERGQLSSDEGFERIEILTKDVCEVKGNIRILYVNYI